MSNVADLIEEYILRKLSVEEDCQIVLNRNSIAEEIACAPSQISYVLNTRFTIARGFTVESRRGLGGYIRIERKNNRQALHQEIIQEINEKTSFTEMKNIIRYLLKNGFIKNREVAILMQAITFAFNKAIAPDRVILLKSLFMALADFADE